MLRRTLATIVTVLALGAPVARAEAAGPDARAGAGIVGTWKGKVYNQDGPAGYTGTVHLTRSDGEYRATVRYSGGVSSTKWIYVGKDGAWFRFREIPRSSSGPGGVAIRAKRSGAKLAVKYPVPDSGYTGYMNARRLR
jgi:hypothetical protein